MERSLRSNNRKSNVTASAIANFTALGYHGTSMRDIASGAGVTVASIYHHFASKQEILQEIMATTMHTVIASTQSGLKAAGPVPAEQLRAIVEAWTLFHTERQSEALIGASELRSLNAEGRLLIVSLRDEQEQIFHDVIGRGVQVGDFRTPYPLEAARAIIHMGQSLASWYRPSGELSPEQIGIRYVELAFAAVRAN